MALKLDKKPERLKRPFLSKFLVVFGVASVSFALYIALTRFGLSTHVPQSWKDGPMGWFFEIAERAGWHYAILAVAMIMLFMFFFIQEHDKQRQRRGEYHPEEMKRIDYTHDRSDDRN